MELVYGAERSNDPISNHAAITELLTPTCVLPFDNAAAYQAGLIRNHLASTGKSIGPFDTLIAGHALSQSMILVTNNTGEFSRVHGLVIEDWIAPTQPTT
jgi:tRNA(fMet)-specific endonuclease VapC